MAKTLTPIISMLIALALLLTYVKPSFEEIKSVQSETQDYTEAIDRSEALHARVNELIMRQNSFSPADLERLEALLPDQIKEVSLMLDIDALSKRHNLTFGNILLENTGEDNVKPLPETVTRSVLRDPGNPAAGSREETVTIPRYYTPVDISFAVTGTYTDFKSFIADLERSLVLMDIMDLTVSATEGDLTTYSVTTRLYSFNPGT